LAATGEYQVCLFDNRGCGRSSISVRPYTAALLARDATKLLDHLGWDSGVHMIGFSLGGMIAQKMMLKQPERFATIAFISSYHSSLYAMPTLSDLGFFVRMFVLGDKSLLPSFVKICFPKRYLNAEFEKGAKVTNYQLIYNALKGAMNDNPERSGATKRVGNFAQLTAAIMHNIGAKELAKVRQKNPDLRMLVFAATLDKVVKYRCGVSLARILKCPLVTFHGAGHMLHIDQREQFHMLLRAHL
ncbi:alpha/beta-hydrolase, partial [Ramicandelaber brevisporus]